MISLVLAAAAFAGVEVPLTAPGPEGPLAGTLVEAEANAPVVLIIPGSGPTDRDGNNPLGVTAAPYRLLAEGLAAEGISTVRVDKRGMFGSKAAVADANAVTIADYATDTRKWIEAIRERTGVQCVWLLGHSEGGLVALAAAQQPEDVCGVVLVSATGRRLGEVLREQLRSNPANEALLEDAMTAIALLEAGDRVEVSSMHPALQALFAPQVQPFLIDLLSHDPARLAAGVQRPMLIVQGQRDLQVTEADARALAEAQPGARTVLLPRMNHVLKEVDSVDRSANAATYADPSLPLAEGLVEAIAGFIRQ